MDARVELLHSVAVATVTVDAGIPETHPSVAILGPSRAGTGSVVDAGGVVLVANYTVLGATDVEVTDVLGKRRRATVVAQDFASGLAAVSTDGLKDAIKPGDSHTLSTGDDVFLVSSLGGGERRSASGAVVAIESFDAYWEYKLDRAVMVSAANPGLGGAALCNGRGELVGVVSLNLGAVGREALAIPAENFFDYRAELLGNGRRVTRSPRPWIGMFCYSLPGKTVVAGVMPGSPGEEAGLRPGDVVLRLNGESFSDRGQLYERLWTYKPGDLVELDVLRDGTNANLKIRSRDAEDFFAIDTN
ncbi:MAG: S1C family serine protease [Candidatus Binatia bacterium]